jgi:hypothetical protein
MKGAVGFSETIVYMAPHPRGLIIDTQGSENLKLHKIVKVLLEKHTFS